MNRRRFISAVASACASQAATALLPESRGLAPSPKSFDFVFFTDTYIRRELSAAAGCAMAVRKIRLLDPAFAIQGGDHIDDALAATRQRADDLFHLHTETEQALGIRVHHTIGKHDVFGIANASTRTDPEYGKRMYQNQFGDLYYSFDFGGCHFVILDSIEITKDFDYEARIDATQLSWLAKDLAAIPSLIPVTIITYVPLVTGAVSYGPPRQNKVGKIAVLNAWEVLPLLERSNVLAVFREYTHINEVVRFRGISYVSSGAVCGNWLHGSRWGTPDGFTVVSLQHGSCTWRYETYGFHSVDPQNA